jgi:hypothetical protein
MTLPIKNLPRNHQIFATSRGEIHEKPFVASQKWGESYFLRDRLWTKCLEEFDVSRFLIKNTLHKMTQIVSSFWHQIKAILVLRVASRFARHISSSFLDAKTQIVDLLSERARLFWL